MVNIDDRYTQSYLINRPSLTIMFNIQKICKVIVILSTTIDSNENFVKNYLIKGSVF